LVPWGTEVLVRIQSGSSEPLILIFAAISALGSEYAYLFLFPFVYWCVDRQVGVGLAYLSMFSAWFNDTLKYIFRIPRPSDVRLRFPYPETSPSFPSGHSQGAVVNWGYLALRFRRSWFSIVAILLILLIGLSRMILAVHFPQDVLGGWTIGLVVLILYLWAEPRARGWLSKQGTGVRAVLAVVVPVVLIFVHPADNEGLYPAPDSISPLAALVGLGIGVLMERARLRFRADGLWWRRLLRFLVGLVVVAILYAGPRLILPEDMPYALEASLRFLRYGVVGWAVAFVCPWLFLRLGLAEREEEGAPVTVQADPRR
jgi:membrane-associated phospholipid phosphatase